MTLENTLLHIDSNLPHALKRLCALLRIPSISTDPSYKNNCQQAAEWLVNDLKSLGFDASIRQTSGHPMVVAHGGSSKAEAKHLLFYGHYDVQPVDPISLWQHDPFEPVIEETDKGYVIRARGASDDKGQLMTFIEACRAWLEVHRELPCKVTFLFEGEEESGSPSLIPFLQENASELKADIALICDTGLFESKTPSIVTMLRGLVGEEVIIKGPDKDLHSGMYGGISYNPIRVLTQILGKLHDENGHITIPGFYDDVDELSHNMHQQWNDLNFDHQQFLKEVGLSTPAGEQGRSPLEMIWSRPTAEINGITGGYTDEGFKTVLPSEARAKVSFRLVARQNPLKIRQSFRDWLCAQLPPDCQVEFHEHGASPASIMNIENQAFEMARQALCDEWQTPAAYIGCGGSIPIAGYFKTYLGLDAMLIGFARDDDQIHSPNEKYDVECFQKGIRSWARFLAQMS